jgi:hypothetical protein
VKAGWTAQPTDGADADSHDSLLDGVAPSDGEFGSAGSRAPAEEEEEEEEPDGAAGGGGISRNPTAVVTKAASPADSSSSFSDIKDIGEADSPPGSNVQVGSDVDVDVAEPIPVGQHQVSPAGSGDDDFGADSVEDWNVDELLLDDG